MLFFWGYFYYIKNTSILIIFVKKIRVKKTGRAGLLAELASQARPSGQLRHRSPHVLLFFVSFMLNTNWTQSPERTRTACAAARATYGLRFDCPLPTKSCPINTP